MSIMWKYLDKQAAVIQVLKDFDNMQFIIDNTDDDIRMEESRLVGIGSPNMDGMPHAHNPQAGEERIINSLEKIDTLKERYRQAVEYMNWFLPAWEKLSEDEQFVLDVFYRQNEYGAEAAKAVCEYFSVERNTAYKKKSRALDRLVLLLYGKE